LHLKRWFEAIKARPATLRAYAIAAAINTTPILSDEESRKILFSQTAANVN
jgi:GST-like protein